MEFLLSYRRLLKGHIARTTLIRSRFSLREPDRRDPRKRDWETIRYDYEPVRIMGTAYKIYERIGQELVMDWSRGRPKYYSMLLYGPPGTGKTTVAENIADALNFRMITITVSDFLAGGGAVLEANAKAIFDVLISQADSVILFDEIDSFLLDRDLPRHSQQETIFQFMTPGMLTKLNDLRRAKRVIFIIATNYESRIDPAIKRTGRIDRTYLVLPPDSAARSRIIARLIEEKWRVRVSGSEPDLPMREELAEVVEREIGEADWQELLKQSLFLGYKDIEGSIKEAEEKNIADLTTRLRERARTTRLGPYLYRFTEKLERAKPLNEFLGLVRLALEVGQDEELVDEKGRPSELAKAAAEAMNGSTRERNAFEKVKAAALALGNGDE